MLFLNAIGSHAFFTNVELV